MYKFLFIPITFLLLSHASIAQTAIRIEGVLSNIDDETVTVHPGYDGFFNDNCAVECPVRNHRFIFTYTTNRVGFVEIGAPGFSKKIIYVHPGDNLVFEAYRKNGQTSFACRGGKEETGNNRLLNAKILNNFLRVSASLIPQIAGLTDTDSAFALIRRYTDSTKTTIDSLYRANAISDSLYRALISHQESMVLFTCGEFLKTTKYLIERDSLTPPLRLDIPGCNQLFRLLYTEYDPFDEKYLSSYTENTNLATKGELIRSHILPVQNPGEKITWAGDHKSFVQTISKQAPYVIDSGFWMAIPGLDSYPKAYVPGTCQQLLECSYILAGMTYGTEPLDVIEREIVLYTRRYPNSEIIPYFQSEIHRLASGKSTIENYARLGIFDTGKDSLILVAGADLDFKNIKELVSTQFGNRAVLIDLWATWCPPCREELQYADTLFRVLRRKDIGMLFISVDDPKNKFNWVKTVNQYKLKGTHYLASEAFGDAIGADLNVKVLGIPRYVLVDRKGNILISSAARPSNLSDLEKQIDKATAGL